MATGLKKRTFTFEWSEHEDLQVRPAYPPSTEHKLYVEIHVNTSNGTRSDGSDYEWNNLMDELKCILRKQDWRIVLNAVVSIEGSKRYMGSDSPPSPKAIVKMFCHEQQNMPPETEAITRTITNFLEVETNFVMAPGFFFDVKQPTQ